MTRAGTVVSVSRQAALALVLGALVAGLSHAAEPPRLVIQITVDQLRGDMLRRSRDRFGPGGFRRLMDHGTYYTNAHYGTGNTFTASGHAVLVTGADTAEHGMVANEWFDREAGKVMYSTADPKHGQSPANLTSTTLGDEIIAASAGQAKVFAVAGKDRSAIIPAGHRGKALWFDEKSGAFASSSYYYEHLPAWVMEWNRRKQADQCTAEQKTSPPDPFRNPFARPRTTFSYSPCLDAVTASFAQALVTHEKLGQRARGVTALPDYLAISFSATDYIGHAYGPNSREHEDQLLQLDATLTDLFRYLDKTVGRDRVLIALSADHGVDDIPEERRALGYIADRFYPQKLLERVNAALKEKLGVTDNLVAAFVPPGFYLDRSKVSALRRDPYEVERALAEDLRTVPGVAYAFPRSDLLEGRLARTPLLDKVQRSFHPERSGDVIIVQEQFWYLYPDAEAFAAMHGSPYSYDTYVPMILAGAGVRARHVARNVEPGSIAPTIAALLGIKPPSGNVAPVLQELFEARP